MADKIIAAILYSFFKKLIFIEVNVNVYIYFNLNIIFYVLFYMGFPIHRHIDALDQQDKSEI